MFRRRERRRALQDDPRQGPRQESVRLLVHAGANYKLYALEGTNFFDSLGNCPAAKTGNTTYDVLGIFTVDPLSVVKVLDRISKDNTLDGQWIEVPFPVAYVIFGEMPSK